MSLGKHWRKSFDIPDDVAYFNCAYAGPLMRAARKAAKKAINRHREPWTFDNGVWFEESEERRALFAQLMGCDIEGVALVPSASYGFAVAAKNIALKNGQRVLVLENEFPSGINTWRRKCDESEAELFIVTRSEGQTWTDALIAAIDERAGVVSVPNVHWIDGALVELVQIAERARAVGAKLVLDTSQSGGVMPIHFAAVRPDYLINVGYKWLFHPYATSYLYVGENGRDGVPLEENWQQRLGSEDFTRLAEFEPRYRPGARRFDMGERSNWDIAPAANAALKHLIKWRDGGMIDALRERTEAIAALADKYGIPVSTRERGPHLMGLALNPGEAKEAAPTFKAANVIVSFRGDIIRLAPHLYNTQDDIGRLADVLAQLRR
ncbi:aminotransferase class V-fold PLP-dependent enzyme [Terricaulis sp.]|uniref:aminotransferase class V-fold PLP-dependent enzyme n=1 Tax=Terricaulis sp. TaxID=2768686 RepID=UPI003783AD05